MNLIELIQKYNTQNEVIIKRKKEILEFNIKAGIALKHDLKISADSENLYVGNTIIEMKDLKKIYLFKVRNRYGGYACSLEIVGKNMLNSISITITTLSEEDLDKIGELFEYFVFSNERDYNKLISSKYEFLIEAYSDIYLNKLNTYNEEQKNTNIININNKNYFFIKILPKQYYKKYLNKKYLLFETKYDNPNYMDVWIEQKEAHRIRKNKIILSSILSLSLIGLAIMFITSSVFEMIEDIKREYEIKEQKELYIEEKQQEQEAIQSLLPHFDIYYDNGFICRDINYEIPPQTDILCIFEFEDGEKHHRLFNKENKVDLETLYFKKGKCKVYVTFTGPLTSYNNKFISEVIISNIIEINL